MYEFLGKFEDFLFDILGLALPGAIFLLVLISPVWFMHVSQMKPFDLQNITLSTVHFFSNIIKIHWEKNMKLTLVTFIILAYLVGHMVKIISITIYSILGAIFDNIINALLYKFYFFLKLKVFKAKKAGEGPDKVKLGRSLKAIITKFTDIITFYPPNYDPANKNLFENCTALIKKQTGEAVTRWYSLFRISSVIMNQEKIKTLATGYLAKYNLYRSLACIFIFSAFYFHFLFKNDQIFLVADVYRVESFIYLVSVFLWYTFHSKFLRYWTLCGNESLVSLFYFLNRQKLVDEKPKTTVS